MVGKALALATLLLTSKLAVASDFSLTIGSLDQQCKQAIRGIDGEDLNPSENFSGGSCMGYVTAASQFEGLLDDPAYCTPDGVLLGQRIRIFVKWAESHPEMLHLPNFMGLRAALTEAFPCRASKRSN